MSKDKQTFVDPETGEEMESTWLARCGPLLLFGLLGVFVGFCFWLMDGLNHLWREFLAGLVGLVGLGAWLHGRRARVERIRNDRLGQSIHDTIARTQHRRRQRLLRSQDDQDVPDGALSRAQTPDDPVPTDAALSVADEAEEAERLSVETEEVTEDQVPLRQ